MEEGSFSVEAAVIVPVIVFAVLSLLFFGFYLRDIILIETSSRALLIEENRYGIYKTAEEKIEDRNEKMALLLECLWWAELVEFEISETGDYAEYTVSANIFGINVSTGNTIEAVRYIDTTDRLRFWKSITEEAKELFFSGGSEDGS